MNKNSTSPIFDDTLDEYPEVNQNDLNRAIRRRSFVEVSKKQNITIALDSDIINWFKEKSEGKEYQSLINATLRDVIARNP